MRELVIATNLLWDNDMHYVHGKPGLYDTPSLAFACVPHLGSVMLLVQCDQNVQTSSGFIGIVQSALLQI